MKAVMVATCDEGGMAVLDTGDKVWWKEDRMVVLGMVATAGHWLEFEHPFCQIGRTYADATGTAGPKRTRQMSPEEKHEWNEVMNG